MDYLQYKNYLAHHGVEGQKWGVRRYQNEDGTLTALGRQHLGIGEEDTKRMQAEIRSKYYNKRGNIKYGKHDDLRTAKAKYISENQNSITTKFHDAFTDPEDTRSKTKIENQDKLYNTARKEIEKSADEIFGSDKQIKRSKIGQNVYEGMIKIGITTLAIAAGKMAIDYSRAKR